MSHDIHGESLLLKCLGNRVVQVLRHEQHPGAALDFDPGLEPVVAGVRIALRRDNRFVFECTGRIETVTETQGSGPVLDGHVRFPD